MRIAVVAALAGCSVTGLDVRERAVTAATATPFTLGSFSLADALATGGVVIVFYRGHW